MVVLDPAKQTRDREEVDFALKRYLDMNRLALQAVAPGGMFLTCSCTGLVSEDDFLDTLRRAAWQAGRIVQVLRVAGAGGDHPFLAACAGGPLSQGGVLPGGVTPHDKTKATTGCASRFRQPIRPAVNGGSTSRGPVNGATRVFQPGSTGFRV